MNREGVIFKFESEMGYLYTLSNFLNFKNLLLAVYTIRFIFF
nr:MAG TPA: hypothetical protein [Caudoviricetes sp.]